MEIRRAGADEARAIADLFIRSRRASVPAIPVLIHADDDVREHFATKVLPVGETWVAVDAPAESNVIVGFLVLHGGWIDHLYVEPGRTGEGIGSALLARATERRPDGLDLWAFQANTGARRFYERHGFVAVVETDGDNEEGEPDVRYRWH